MSGITLTEVADATIPTPAAGKVTVYMSTEEAGPAFKDDGAAVTPLQGATGGTGPTGPGYGGTSTTSLAIGTGSKAFTTQAGMAYVVGSRVRAASNADPDADWMEGVVSAYVTTTLTVLMDLTAGSGTHTDWNLSLAGEQGPDGDGVPPTVVAHGAMGATETFDYSAGPAHEGELDANLTVTLTGAVAGECILSLGLTQDGGGGNTVTLPGSVSNAAEIEAAIDLDPGAYNLIVLRTVDSGTNWYGLRVAPGATGATGAGVPTGGTANQALTKIDATDFNTQWVTLATGLGGVALSPTSDTYIDSQAATTNNDAGTEVVCGGDWGDTTFCRRPLFTFDISALAGKTIIAAFLKLYRTSTSANALTAGQLIQVRRILRAYSPTQATWDIYTTGNNWTTAGAAGSATDVSSTRHGSAAVGTTASDVDSWVQIPMATLLKESLDASETTLRLIMNFNALDATSNATHWASVNHATAALRPQLIVAYL